MVAHGWAIELFLACDQPHDNTQDHNNRFKAQPMSFHWPETVDTAQSAA
jgi:hypothetical protein